MYDYWRRSMTSVPVRIGTHDGSFHADEVLAISILIALHRDHHIVRTRDPDTLSWMDIVVDVGGVYDHTLKRYDHHMPNPPTLRGTHVYSSAGLVWRHYGTAYLAAIGIPKHFTFENTTIDLIAAVDSHIRHQWIEPIDRSDNGTTQEITPLSVMVQAMRPTDPVKSKTTYDTQFLAAVSMVSHIFERSCFHAADHAIAQTKHITADKQLLRDDKVVVTRYPIPSYRYYVGTSVHFAVSPSLECEGLDHNYVIRPIPISSSKTPKTAIPKILLGARREAIESLTGIQGVSYVHHGGFLVLADTEDAALVFCEFCLTFNQ